MPVLIASLTFIAILAFSGPSGAVDRRPCPPGQREVIAKDGTTMCVNAYASRAVTRRPGSKGGEVTSPISASAPVSAPTVR